MPWISRETHEGMIGALLESKKTEDKLWKQNRELMHLVLRMSAPVARQAVNEEAQMESMQEEAFARADATRSTGDASRRARRNGPGPGDIDLDYDETAEIGGQP